MKLPQDIELSRRCTSHRRFPDLHHQSILVEGFPFLDLSRGGRSKQPVDAELYATASYTNPRGQIFHGAYAAYVVTIPVAAANPSAAEAFVRLLLSEKGMTMFERAGFYRFRELRIAGDESAAPQSIRWLITAQCRP
jgi:Bacterial extracellular solute-binding protein